MSAVVHGQEISDERLALILALHEERGEEPATVAALRELQHRRSLVAPLAQSIGIVRENAELKAENARLRGIKPKMPPFPPNGSGLPRYGLRWNGPEQPLATPMEDGYWTPWHLADHYKARCERMEAALDKYGAHKSGCGTSNDGEYNWRCTCGLDAALKDSPGLRTEDRSHE
jgi:hypothetical protein